MMGQGTHLWDERLEGVLDEDQDISILLRNFNLEDIALFQDMFETADLETIIEHNTSTDETNE